jgi:SAM-dependent methyltransferase
VTVPPRPLSAEYFDDWYASKGVAPAVAEITNRHMGLPADLSAGVVAAEAIPELITGLRLKPGGTLLDLACGRAGYGLTIALSSGARLIGVDFSAQALAQAREQATRLGLADAEFRVGQITASGLPDATADAVLCTDSIQFPDHPADAYREIRRVLKPGGRVMLTCWEPVDPGDERLSARLRQVDLAAGLAGAGFTGIAVEDRPAWRARERALWEEAVTIDPGDDPALHSFRDEATRSLGHFDLIRRVVAAATAP